MSPGTRAPERRHALLAGQLDGAGPRSCTSAAASPKARRRAHWTTRLALAVLVVAGSAAFVPLLLPGTAGEQEDGSGSSAAQIVFIACYGFLLLAAWLWPTARPRGLLPDSVVYLLGALAAASVLWSLSPSVSARHAVGLVLTVAVAAMLPRLMAFGEFLSVLRATCWFVTLSSLVYTVAASTAAVDVATPSALRGVFTTKNELGRFSAFACMIFLVSSLLTSDRVRNRSRLGFVVALGFLYLSRSATSVTVVVLLTVFVLGLNDLRRRGEAAMRWMVPAFVVAIAAVVAAVSLLEVSGLTRILGRDSTFTGRMDLWHLVVQAISLKPWLGYGYQAFWVTPGGPADQIRVQLPFPVPHAHDGFLDVWLELGVVAVVLVVVLLLRMAVRSISATLAGSEAGLAASATVAFMVLSNLTESDLLRANSCYLLVLFALMAYVGGWCVDRGARALRVHRGRPEARLQPHRPVWTGPVR